MAAKRSAHKMDEDNLYSLGKEIGELIGAVRANNHAVNNLSQKVDAFSKVAAIQETMLEQSKLLVEELKDIKRDVESLKKSDDKREGATGILAVIVKSPLLGWLAAVLVWAWAVANGWRPQ